MINLVSTQIQNHSKMIELLIFMVLSFGGVDNDRQDPIEHDFKKGTTRRLVQ